MNSEIKAAWVEALRSGEYKQGRGVLAEQIDGEMRYCCLGVLCDILLPQMDDLGVRPSSAYANRHVLEFTTPATSGHDYCTDGCDGLYADAGTLPQAVVEYAELPLNNPSVRLASDGGPYSLAELNDNGKTFDEIADIIEEHL